MLPRSLRFAGIIFFISGLLFAVARFKYGFKPDALDLKTFAMYSSYLETKYMQIIRNNMGEEISGFLLLAGLFLISFSREKHETEQLDALRLKAFFLTAYLNFAFLLGCLFFTYGMAFMYMLMVNMGFGLLAYTITFRILHYQSLKQH